MSRERIEHARGAPYVMVLFTHDYGRAGEEAWKTWVEEACHDVSPDPLPRPRRVWLRRHALPNDALAEDEGFAYWWNYDQPGRPGVMPAVEFVL